MWLCSKFFFTIEVNNSLIGSKSVDPVVDRCMAGKFTTSIPFLDLPSNCLDRVHTRFGELRTLLVFFFYLCLAYGLTIVRPLSGSLKKQQVNRHYIERDYLTKFRTILGIYVTSSNINVNNCERR